MSKFLKFIVNVFLVVAILVAAAILIPPITGITTTIVDTASMDTNLPLGSITYSTDIDVSDLQVGDEVLKENNASTYSYIIKGGDAASGKFTVVSSTDPNGKDEEISLRNTVSKVAVVVPYIGYIIIAMHSTEGIIIIALAVVLMIILFILSELWKSRDDDEDDEDVPEQHHDEAETEEDPAAKRMPVSEVIFDTDIPELKPDIDMTSDSSAAYASEDDEAEAHPESEEADTEEAEAPAEPEEIPTETAAEAEPLVVDDTAENITDDQGEVVVDDAAEQVTDGQNEVVVEDVAKAGVVSEAIEPVLVPDVAAEEATDVPSPSLTDTETENAEVTAPKLEDEISSIIIEDTPKESPKEPEFDLADAIFAATEEVEAEEEKRSEEAEKHMEETQVILPSEYHMPEEEEAEKEAPKEEEELPEEFVPVEHMTLDELLDQARKAGYEPEVRKDNATDITIVDYSDII